MSNCLKEIQNVPTSGQSVIVSRINTSGVLPGCKPTEGLQWISLSNWNVRGYIKTQKLFTLNSGTKPLLEKHEHKASQEAVRAFRHKTCRNLHQVGWGNLKMKLRKIFKTQRVACWHFMLHLEMQVYEWFLWLKVFLQPLQRPLWSSPAGRSFSETPGAFGSQLATHQRSASI